MEVARPKARGRGRQSDVIGFEQLAALKNDTLYRLLGGVDPPEGVEMPADQLAALDDPLAVLLFKRGKFPGTAQEVLTELDRLNADPRAVSEQRSFFVGEGTLIPPSAGPDVRRELRFVVTRASKANDAPEVLISVSATGEPALSFLQLAGWDDTAGHFNYYLRLEGTTAWIWAGNSNHALEAPTRGKGPFAGHVNGSLVMKELKEPWSNWQSSRVVVTAVDPGSALAADPLFTKSEDANHLEAEIVRPWINRWTVRRLKAIQDAGRVANPEALMRQLFTTTTANLVTSDEESSVVAEGGVMRLPLTFFFNLDVLSRLGITVPEGALALADGTTYASALTDFEFHLSDGEGFEQKGDTHFAFLVPEPAFEDNAVVLHMVPSGLLPGKFIAAAMMVDYPNPVYSERRASLLVYTPDTASWTAGASDLADRFVARVTAAPAASKPGSAESEFLSNWNLPDADWAEVFAKRLADYRQAVAARLNTKGGFYEYMQLAESRRRRFAKTPLAEFALLLPQTNIAPDAPELEMVSDGTVRPKG